MKRIFDVCGNQGDEVHDISGKLQQERFCDALIRPIISRRVGGRLNPGAPK